MTYSRVWNQCCEHAKRDIPRTGRVTNTLSYDERVMMSPEMTKRRDQLVTHNEEEENETGDKDEDSE
jgi:hypothetical protein